MDVERSKEFKVKRKKDHNNYNKKVFICGSLEKETAKSGILKFKEAEKVLIEKNYQPINKLACFDEKTDRCIILDFVENIRVLSNCDGIYLLTDYYKSKESRTEKYYAEQFGLFILYEDEFKELTGYCKELNN